MKEEETETSRRFTPGQMRRAGIAGLTVVLLLVIGILGNVRITHSVKKSMEESIHLTEEKLASEEAAEAEAAAMEEEAETAISLTYMERQILNILWEKMDSMDLEGAARILNENRELLEKLFFGKLADRVILYDGKTIQEGADGHGLVFRKAGTVFYGDFKDEKPNGMCVALQAIELDEGPRYDYSAGIWNNGVMEGTGECGYNYYEGIEGDNARKTIKKGNFADNLMEGEIVYTSVNSQGEETSWTMTAEHGVIVPDEKWQVNVGDDGRKVYRLAADNDEVHAYAVDESAMGEVRWKNMIEWEQ